MQRRGASVVRVPPGNGRPLWVDGLAHTFKAVSEDTNGAYALLEITVPPQSGVPPHIHHWEDEAAFVLEGALEFAHGDQTWDMTTGSFVRVPRGNLHLFRNVGPSPARILALFTPAGFERFLLELGRVGNEKRDSPERQTEEMERAFAIARKHGMEYAPGPGQSWQRFSTDQQRDGDAS